MIKDLHRRGISISEIARQTGRDRKTIRRILAEPIDRKAKKRVRKVPQKLAGYESYLHKRMGEGVYNTRKLYRELKERGYRGGLTRVIEYVQPYRKPREEVAVMRFETEPGHQAQVDWGHFGYLNYEGQRRKLYAFVMTLGWSRAMYLEFTVQADTTWFLRCHQRAFHYFGGVPREVLHDNLKSAVVSRDRNGGIHWNERYLDFASSMGFSPRACAPYRAQTKGKVERSIGYVRGNFWVGLQFSDLNDLNRQALGWLNSVANPRLHGTTGVSPFSRLAQEALQALPTQAFDTRQLAYRRAARDCTVSYMGNFYSVPACYAGQMLVVKEDEQHQLAIYTVAGELVAHHPVLPGKRQMVLNPAHYAGLPLPSPHAPLPTARQILEPLAIQHPVWPAPQVEQRPLAIYALVLEVSND